MAQRGLAILALLHVAVADVNGNWRCPCAAQADLPPVPGPLPATYGVNCYPHERLAAQSDIPNGTFSFVDQCRSSAPPSWCSSSWCYVAAGCNLTSSIVATLRNNSFYNYATCGYLSYQPVADQLRGTAIRVVMIGKGAACNYPFKMCSGAMSDFSSLLFEKANATLSKELQLVNGDTQKPQDFLPSIVVDAFLRSPVSRGFESNPYTACVFATGMGYVDLCVATAGLTVTVPRSAVSEMLPIYRDNYFLCTKVNTTVLEPGRIDRMLLMFKPFTTSLWASLFLLMLCFFLLLFWVELGPTLQPNKTLRERANSALDVGHYVVSVGTKKEPTRPFLPATPAGKLTSISLAVLVLFVGPVYTAALAAAQVKPTQTNYEFASVEDVGRRGATVCGGSAATISLLVHWVSEIPEANFVLSKDGAVKDIDSGRCQVAITTVADCQCQLGTVGTPLLTVSVGLASSRKVSESLRYWIANLNKQNVWDNLAAQDRKPPVCPKVPKPDKIPALSTADLATPLIAGGMAMGTGILQKLWDDHIKEALGPLGGQIDALLGGGGGGAAAPPPS